MLRPQHTNRHIGFNTFCKHWICGKHSGRRGSRAAHHFSAPLENQPSQLRGYGRCGGDEKDTYVCEGS